MCELRALAVRRTPLPRSDRDGCWLPGAAAPGHGSEGRMKKAAMELFEEQGFEDTSAVQFIAELAAGTGSRIFRTAYRKWLESNDDTDLPSR